MMETETEGFSTFERLLYWFLIPAVFTLVLLGALLYLFDYNVLGEIQKLANRVPVLERIVPDPKPAYDSKADLSKTLKEQQELEELRTQIGMLQAQLAAKEAELLKANETASVKGQELEELAALVADLQARLDAKTQEVADYDALVQETAKMYADMMPSKAAAILQNLTLEEQVLILSSMKADKRVKILEKMDPAKAADVSILIKDAKPSRDLQIAALQSRLDLQGGSKDSDKTKTPDSHELLGETLSTMTPDSAALLLAELHKSSPAMVTKVLIAMDVKHRSDILSALTNLSQETAAAITKNMMQ